jgi:predicted DNA-binding transcriptional regulator AlpA
MNRDLKLEDLPEVVNQLTNEIKDLKQLVSKLFQSKAQSKEWLTLIEASDIIGVSKHTIRKKVQNGEMPRRLRNNKLVFNYGELNHFMYNGEYQELEKVKNKAYEAMVSKFRS